MAVAGRDYCPEPFGRRFCQTAKGGSLSSGFAGGGFGWGWHEVEMSAGLGAAAGLVALVVWWRSAPGGQAAAATPFLALSRVPVPEMPATAADLVLGPRRFWSAKPPPRRCWRRDHDGPARVTPNVVNAICRRNPEVAGTVVATAIQLQPEDELAFCRAAVCGAPDCVEPVVAAACQAAPASFANVAMVAFECRPDADPLILDGLTNALPGLMPYVDQARQPGGTNDFPTVIKRTAQLITDAAKAGNGK